MDKLAWTSGFLEATGSFSVTSAGVPQLMIRSSRNPEAIKKFANLWDLNVREVRGNESCITISGKPLYVMMARVWTNLSLHRRREYKKVLKRTGWVMPAGGKEGEEGREKPRLKRVDSSK